MIACASSRAAISRYASPTSGASVHSSTSVCSRPCLPREPHFVVEVLAAWDPDDDPAPHRAWAEAVYTDLAPHALDGGYPNLIGPDQAAQARNAYGPNATRLAELKLRYDPDNVFSATTLPSAD